MTLAVVVATEPIDLGTAAGLAYDADRSLLARLLDQLASLNVQEIHVISRRDLAPAVRRICVHDPPRRQCHAILPHRSGHTRTRMKSAASPAARDGHEATPAD